MSNYSKFNRSVAAWSTEPVHQEGYIAVWVPETQQAESAKNRLAASKGPLNSLN